MRSAKTIALLVIGAGIGAMAVLAVQPAQAQTAARLTRGAVLPLGRAGVVFFSDSQSGGCWILLTDGSGKDSLSVATAPATACK
jgi:hypothetical protein